MMFEGNIGTPPFVSPLGPPVGQTCDDLECLVAYLSLSPCPI